MSNEELEAALKEIIAEVGAAGPQAMGNDQRLIWNDEYAGLAYYREVKWVYEDPQTCLLYTSRCV